MTPADLRARADREERVYSANELAKMLRAGADAMEERDRLMTQLMEQAMRELARLGQEYDASPAQSEGRQNES